MTGDSLSQYGSHRVLKPSGALPQAALQLDPSPKLQSENELLLDVDSLMLDSTSMRQLQESCAGDFQKISSRILEIVAERGKMHNPVTNSGGVLIGRVKEVGSRFFDIHPAPEGGWSLGQSIVPVASLSALALKLTKIISISGDRVKVEGQAVMFACMRVCPVPEGFTPELALACVDISSLIPQVKRIFLEIAQNEPIRVLVMGCGKAGIAALYALRDIEREMGFGTGGLPKVQLLAVDSRQSTIDWVAKRKLADACAALDATKAVDLFDFVSSQTGGVLCDLIINVVNVPGTETATVLCAREKNPRGTILWFSMATRFDQAALATDSLGKDITMLIGNGVAEGQVEQTVQLVNAHPDLRELLEVHV